MNREKIIKIFFELEIENKKDTSDPDEIKIEINRFFKNLFAKKFLKSLPQINNLSVPSADFEVTLSLIPD